MNTKTENNFIEELKKLKTITKNEDVSNLFEINKVDFIDSIIDFYEINIERENLSEEDEKEILENLSDYQVSEPYGAYGEDGGF